MEVADLQSTSSGRRILGERNEDSAGTRKRLPSIMRNAKNFLEEFHIPIAYKPADDVRVKVRRHPEGDVVDVHNTIILRSRLGRKPSTERGSVLSKLIISKFEQHVKFLCLKALMRWRVDSRHMSQDSDWRKRERSETSQSSGTRFEHTVIRMIFSRLELRSRSCLSEMLIRWRSAASLRQLRAASTASAHCLPLSPVASASDLLATSPVFGIPSVSADTRKSQTHSPPATRLFKEPDEEDNMHTRASTSPIELRHASAHLKAAVGVDAGVRVGVSGWVEQEEFSLAENFSLLHTLFWSVVGKPAQRKAVGKLMERIASKRSLLTSGAAGALGAAGGSTSFGTTEAGKGMRRRHGKLSGWLSEQDGVLWIPDTADSLFTQESAQREPSFSSSICSFLAKLLMMSFLVVGLFFLLPIIISINMDAFLPET
eukprot:GILJ01016576.1.p1 GENE.GILJ01016576.1~~GILJ01016576.1.p1  ORF type:complete len:429 (-),score=35.60 GILJ01016576.1:292-1578(-)